MTLGLKTHRSVSPVDPIEHSMRQLVLTYIPMDRSN